MIMEHSKDAIWKRHESTGVLSLHGTHGNYLAKPEFIPGELMEEWFHEPGLKGIIIKGSGRHFSAGADLERLKQMARDEAILAEKISDVPVIAEISGVCFGGGLEIALACHIRICSDNALFAFPEVNWGIMPGLGGTVTLSNLIGPGKSTEMILSGEIANAGKALEIKLVDHVVPSKELDAFTMDFMHKLTADREIDVIHSVMKSIRNSRTIEFEKALEEETRLFCALAVRNLQKK
jgi:enoyl-CoA hydratase/carnithine racemase